MVRRRAGDAVVVALVVTAQVNLWVADVPGPKVALILFDLCWTVPFLWRRRFSLAVPIFVVGVVTVESFFFIDALDHEFASFLSALVAFWSVGAYNDRRRAIAGFAILYVGAQVVTTNFGDWGLSDFLFLTVIFGIVALAGQALHAREAHNRNLRARTERLERERAERAIAAVADERARIARELHDVVAHSISVMTIQAGAARLLLDEEPQRAEEPLLSIEETGRETLAEMRRLVGVLRKDMAEGALEPRPSLDNLGALIEQARVAGLPVELAVDGDAEGVTPGVDLAAYRIVQEALTNVRKHGGSARTRVTVRYARDTLELEITNDGQGGRNGGGVGSGHGLVGMRERVAVYGGELEAGPRASGGYRVLARLPLERAGR